MLVVTLLTEAVNDPVLGAWPAKQWVELLIGAVLWPYLALACGFAPTIWNH
jgi:hypothetical protein